MIIFDGVTKSYPMRDGSRTVVLDDFSGTFRTDRNVGILGRNGAGKSTLMRLLAGSDAPTSGAIYRDARVSWPLGFSGALSRPLTGRQNLRFIADVYDDSYERLVDFVEDFSELGRWMDEPVEKYSSGMRARLAFGVSMAMRFDYYLIDEVIGVGDSAFKDKCAEVLRTTCRDSAVILVSHSTRLLRDFCDIGGNIVDGRLTFYDTLDEAIYAHETSMKSI